MKFPFNSQFISFYEVNWNRPHTHQLYQAYNGFSTLGDLVQVTWLDTFKDIDTFEPKSEFVYISCHYHKHLDIIFEWAKKFKSTHFLCGGSMFKSGKIGSSVNYIPLNVTLTSKTLQEHFSIPQTDWKMSFPYNDKPLRYSFGNGLLCYWQKCNFCVATVRDKTWVDPECDYKFLRNAPKGIVYLSNPSIPPVMLPKILPLLSQYPQSFALHIRGGEKELKALKSVKFCNWKKFHFLVGVEFPSDRMLTKMNKGVTLEELRNIIIFLQEKTPTGLYLYLVYGWPDLIKHDITEAGSFFDIINKETVLIYRPLTVFEDVGKIGEWITYKAYKPTLSKRADEANTMWLDMLKKWTPQDRYQETIERRKA